LQFSPVLLANSTRDFYRDVHLWHWIITSDLLISNIRSNLILIYFMALFVLLQKNIVIV
jgi:hypothetical protein